VLRIIAFAVVAVAIVGILSGCSIARTPISYSLYADVTGDGAVTSNPIPASPKVGEASAMSVIGITTGDCSISAAAKAGGITKISYVDYHSMGILGVYAKTTTKVYGE
jgi:hypothetical protein